MIHQRSGLFLLAVVLFAQNANAQQVWYTDLNEARRVAREKNLPILCHFWATWCPPCRKMESNVLNQPAVVQQLRANVVGVKIDVTKHPDLASRMNIQTLPADVFLEPDGRRMLEATGAHELKDYTAMIDRAGTRYQQLVASRTPKKEVPVDVVGTEPQEKEANTPKLMLEGYCPVALAGKRAWTEGKAELETEHEGQLYRFADEESRDQFSKSPEKYVPQFLGCDPVIVWTTDKGVPGSIEFAAFYDNRLFLFTNDDNRQKFKTTPDKYLTARVVLHLDQIETIFR